MANGSVLRYDGKRGVTWSIQYRGHDRRQVREMVGRASDGMTRKKAETLLRQRLVAVERDAYSKPVGVTFESFALEWLEHHAAARGLKRSTDASYRTIVRKHLNPWLFGRRKLADISPELVEQYLRAKREEGLAPASLHRHLATLSLIFGAAHRKRLVRENPIPLVERPKATRKRWRILTPDEIVGIGQAWNEMIEEADPGDHRDDLMVARALYTTLIHTGIRRGEALGLRWRHVRLADPAGPSLRVEETWTRASVDTPKSEAGARTISLGRTISAALFDYRAWTPFAGEDERLFVNPRTGHPINPTRYGNLLRAVLKRAGVDGYMRPCHDLRHSSITNAAATGKISPEALMQRSGHSDYSTTRRYVDLAGERFRAEADALDARLSGGAGRPVEQDAEEA